MSDWLTWAKQPFSASTDSKQPDNSQQPPHTSGKEEKEEKKPEPSSSSSASSWLSSLPSLPSLSLPSFLSTASASSSSSSSAPAATYIPPALTDSSPPYPLPSISSSPTTSLAASPLLDPPPGDVSYLRSLLSSPAAPGATHGVTPSGLRWERVAGVEGFALSLPPTAEEMREAAAPHLIPDAQLAHVRQICQQLQQQQQRAGSNTAATPAASPATAAATELHTHTRGAVILNNTNESASSTGGSGDGSGGGGGGGCEEDEREVAVLDVDNIDWWTLVDPARDKAAALPYSIEEGYVVVRHEDTVDAMAQYLAQVLANHPHASRLSARELAAVIDRSLRPLDERRGWLGAVGGSRYVTYGYYAYLVYSWTSTAYSLYRRPWLIKLAATGAVQAASWLLVLFV